MDNIYLFGAITSIIMFCVFLGKMLWRAIKNSKISFFNLFMLFMVSIHALYAGYCFGGDEDMKGAITTAFLMFWILSWLVQYLFQKQQEILDAQMEIIKDTHDTMASMNQDARESIDSTGKHLLDIIQWIGHILDLMREIVKEMEQVDENFNNEIKTLQDEIRKVDITREREDPTK